MGNINNCIQNMTSTNNEPSKIDELTQENEILKQAIYTMCEKINKHNEQFRDKQIDLSEIDLESIKGDGRKLIGTYDAMDDANKTAMDVMANGGIDAALKHMITGEDCKPRSYAEMRAMYG